MASKIRDKIIDHAITLFARSGYSGCSTKEIAKRADVTEGSLFRLYKSKSNLFTEALSVALASKQILRHRRIVAFAMLEHKGMTAENIKSIRRFSATCPIISALRSICK
jgi:AcrR family transcriptional regulator